jgi:hypothetical protein
MPTTQTESVSDTVTERTPRRSPNARLPTRYRLGSLSGAFALLPDAYQGAEVTDTSVPRGVYSQNRAAFEKRETP